MQLTEASMQARILEFENPTFGYRLGEDGEIEKGIFDGEPLPEGWVDSPAKVDDALALVEIVKNPIPYAVSTPLEDDDSAPSRPYADHKFNDLKSEFKRRTGKGPTTGTNKVTLIEMIEELDAVEREDPSWRHAENR